ncbi:MAG TPA: bifunctional 4-hydroxy-2-oxoglutarate aldolase/2-dehydro-3-deoxy-phosphogluconate aldolase [Gemmatimonadaceae bacterium]|nr:bifunctional 4-hydroxy-2-oxoglutarate aldolase/2-dehydro-3-deoxy-phosphogluconate aldolase [Gemmatimonadaceae bacterium]
MTDVIGVFRECKIVPVLVIEDPASAVPVAQALAAGGLTCAEVTFRTARATEVLSRMTGEVPGLLAGAGTVLSVKQAQDARVAGAKFIVAPGFNPEVAAFCAERQLPYFPGIATPTELERALGHDLHVLKLFPAEPLGGVTYLKAIAAPYGSAVEFMPTGGISASNIGSYLALKQVVACGGSWMAPAEWVKAGRFDAIREETAKAVAAARPLSGATA